LKQVLKTGVSVGAPLGNLGRGSVYRELLEVVEGGLREWSISFYGSSVRGSWRGGGCFAGDTEGYKRKLWRRASLSIGGPLGNLEGRSSTRHFERWMKGALEVECLSLSL